MRRFLRHSCWILLLALVPATAFAQEAPPDPGGLSGRLQVGGFFLQTDSQLSTEGTNRRTSDLDGPAAPHTLLSGLAAVYLRYQFESGTALYAGNPLEAGEGLAVAAGVSQPIGESTLDFSVTWSPIEEVWENPYQTNDAREETAVDAYGFKLEWQEIGGGPWQLSYGLGRIDVEDDVIGELEPDLERDGWIHRLGVEYTLPLSPGVELKPHLRYAYADREGESNRYHGMEAGFLVQRARPPWVLVGVLSGAYHHYPEDHPLFSEDRRDGILTAFGQVMHLNLFGFEQLFASMGAGYIRSDSSIDFFDSQTVVGLASVGINF